MPIHRSSFAQDSVLYLMDANTGADFSKKTRGHELKMPFVSAAQQLKWTTDRKLYDEIWVVINLYNVKGAFLKLLKQAKIVFGAS